MGIWETITVMVVAAVVAFITSRLTRYFEVREADKAADAEWTPMFLPRRRGMPWVAVVITNTGSKQALDVTLKLGGNGSIEFDADLNLKRIRPGESIRFVVNDIGNSVAAIEWTNHRGVRDLPFHLFLAAHESKQLPK